MSVNSMYKVSSVWLCQFTIYEELANQCAYVFKYWSSRVRRKLNYVFWLLHRKRLFIFTRIFNTTERKYSLNEGVRINDKGKECLAFNFDPKETKSFDKVPGPTGIHAIPFVGTTLHFKPFGKTISISVWYLSRLNHPSFKRQRSFDIQCNAGFFFTTP